MSADNGIYILKTKRTALENPKGTWTNNRPNDVWRIAYTSAIDNFDYYKNKAIHNLGAYMFDTWGRSPVYDSADAALGAAKEMADKIDPTEYGINFIDASEYVFYGDH